MEFLVMLIQFLLAISILVGLHELGHLLAAKAFGMRVEKFSIGFPPKIFGIKIGETEYSVGALPLGGYVKILGMMDESMDTESLKGEPQPWEFRAKPAWQRLIVMLGGIIVNVILGIVIFWALAFINGQTYYPADEVNKNGLYANEVGKTLGFERGDKIKDVNGEKAEKFTDIYNPEKILSDNGYFTVIRDGKEKKLPITKEFLNAFTTSKSAKTFVEPLFPFEIGTVSENSPASNAGIQPGDKILSVDGKVTPFFQDFSEAVQDKKSTEIILRISRNGQEKELSLTTTADAKVGFFAKILLDEARKEFSIGEAFVEGNRKAFGSIWLNIQAFKKIFRRELNASESMSGPIGIMQAYGTTFDWTKFWGLTAMISMILAFMNLLPIPALDGGHVMFLLYEMVSGRTPSDKVLENSQKFGMVILIVLTFFIFGNDIYKVIRDLISG